MGDSVSSRKLLLVEDNRADAFLLQETLAQAASGPFEITWVSSMAAALDALARESFATVMLDLSLPDSHGLVTIKRIHEAAPTTAIIVVTGLGDDDVAMSAIRHGAQDYLVKGHADAELVSRTIRYAVDRKAAQVALQAANDELETKVRQRTADLKWVNQALQMLSACNKAIVRISDEKSLLDEICRIILNIGGYRMAWVGFAQNDPGKTVKPVASVGFEDEYLSRINITSADEPHGRGPTGTCIRENRTVIGHDFATDPELAPWRQQALQRGYRSSVAMPLIAGGQTIGALTIYAQKPAAFDDKNIDILQEMADDLAYGIIALRTRTALWDSQQKLQQVVHSAPVLIWAFDMDSNCMLAEGNLEPLGLSCEQIVGRHMGEIFGDRPDILGSVERAKGGQQITAEVEFCGLVFESRYSPMRDEAGSIVGAMCVSVDITERKRMEQEVLVAAEREQRRIGRDLHDSIQGNLTGIGFMLGSLKQRLNKGAAPDTLAADVDELSKIVNQTLGQARGLARGLCPVQLKDDGLVNALRQLADSTGSLFRLPCQFICQHDVRIADETVATHLYYICREAVNNALKHGKAKSIQIRLDVAGPEITLAVQDDGVGLPEGPAKHSGMGLRTMGYRAKMIGANLDVCRVEPTGTVVHCTMQGKGFYTRPATTGS